MVKSVWHQNEMSSQGWIDTGRKVAPGEEDVSPQRNLRIPNYNPQYATRTDPRAQYGPTASKEQKRPFASRIPVVLPGQPAPGEIPRRPSMPPRTQPFQSGYLFYPILEHEPGSDSDSSSDDEDENEPPAKAEPKLTIRIPPLSRDRARYIPELDEVVSMGKRRREDDVPRGAAAATPSRTCSRPPTPGVSVQTIEVADPFADDDDDDDMDTEEPLVALSKATPPKGSLRRQPRPQPRRSGSYASFGLSSPLRPEDAAPTYTCVCAMPNCRFVATSDAHLKHHMRTFQHGKIAPASCFDDDETVEDDVKDDPMEMI